MTIDWAWGKEAQFQSDVVPQVGLDGSTVGPTFNLSNFNNYVYFPPRPIMIMIKPAWYQDIYRVALEKRYNQLILS
jgi:hypothetical protein